MRLVTIERNFESWRTVARALLAARVPPEQVLWTEAGAAQPMLAGLAGQELPSASPSPGTPGEGWGGGQPGWGGDQPRAPRDPAPTPALPRRTGGGSSALPVSLGVVVPPRFLDLAQTVASFRDDGRWWLLYRGLWRIALGGERHLLEIATDDDVHQLLSMEKRVRFDRHKMTAFVRFREISTDVGPHYVAWYRPDHLIVRDTASFFAKRFATMRWSILTPDECAHHDPHTRSVTFTPGVPSSHAPAGDNLEDLWRSYYASVFNPARVNVAAMKKEMPARFWDVLPETRDIPELLRDAPRRVGLMVRNQPRDQRGATAFLPAEPTLDNLRVAVQTCRGCSICEHATQAVFGEGPANAMAMLVGEQPGDQEDLAGRPFVGPAGQLMDEALATTGLDRSALYITGVVKHFKFERRGHRRIHATPNAREIAACVPWLHAEIAAVRPRMILCLGATAARALLGREFRLTQDRGRVLTTAPHAPWMMATFHPSALLRIPDETRRAATHRLFLSDLAASRDALHAVAHP
jgi:probable DNA metabolism protein